MPIGYYNQSAAREQERKHKRHALEAGLLVGAIIGRKPLGIIADKFIGKLAASPTIQAVSQKMATKALNQLEHLSGHLSNFGPLKGYYKDTGGLIGRRDLAGAESYLQGKLTRDLMYSEAAQILPEALLRQRGKAVGGTWTQEGIDALIEDQGFFTSILYKHEYTDEVSNIRSKISNSQNGAFYKYLEKTNQLDAAGIHNVASELTDVIWGVKGAPRSKGRVFISEEGIGIKGLWKRAGDRNNNVRSTLSREYSKKVIAEAEHGQSNWEKLFGLQNQKMSDRERIRYEKSLGTDKDALKGLTIDRQNNRFSVGDRAYNFSALGHMGRNLGSFMNERLSIPFSPLQTSISPGQLFPFIKRHGDSPQIGTLSNDFKTGKLSFFVRDRKVSVDTTKMGRQGHIIIDPHRYSFLLVNKRHLRNLSESQRHADNERLRREQLGDYSTKDQVKDFFRPKTTPGSVPYTDAPQAFLRKWNKKEGRSYLPNLLSNAAKSDVKNDREVLALIHAMQHGARDINDDATVSAYEALKDFKVQQGFHEVAQKLRSKENTSAANWASAHQDLKAYFKERPTSQPRIRRLMEDLEVYKDDPRALEAYLNRTASFRASRDPEKFLGLHLGTGVKRLTHLDILRHDLMLDFVRHARVKGVSADQFAEKFAGTAHTDALALTHASELERIAYTDGAEGVNAYIKARPKVQKILEDMSKKRRNILELQPKQEADWEDFASRDRMIIMRKYGEDYGDTYEAQRAKGQSVTRSLFEATSWKQLYNLKKAALGTSAAHTAFDTTAEQIKIGVKGLFGGIRDADGNLAPQGVLGGGTATQSGLNAYWMMDRLHEAFESVGWGLPDQYKTSAGTLGAAMLVGRFLPLTLIPEAHKLYNRITRDIPFLRWANTDIARSHALRVAEHISHHAVNHKHLTSLLPGLDFYTDSRDKREDDIHERYADYTPVRKGRWWLFGSREAVFGQKVSFYVPSAQRLALSDWQGASNVDGSSWRHFAHAGGYINPTNWFGGAYWYERCVLPDVLIQTSGIVKRIDEIVVGDSVITHTGKTEVVSHIWPKQVSEDIIEITGYNNGLQPLKTTHDHKIFAYKSPVCKKTKPSKPKRCTPALGFCTSCKQKINVTPTWIPAEELIEGDYTVLPLPCMPSNASPISIKDYLIASFEDNGKIYSGTSKGRQLGLFPVIDRTPDFYRLVGYTLAEGHVKDRQCSWTFNIKEKQFIEDVKQLITTIFGGKVRVVDYPLTHKTTVYWDNTVGAKLLRNLCYSRKEKYIHPILLTDNKTLLFNLLLGWFRGDAYWGKAAYNVITCTSISAHLISTGASILNYLGYNPSSDQHNFAHVDERGWNIKNQYDLSLFGKEADAFRAGVCPASFSSTRHSFRAEGFIYKRIKKIIKTFYSGLVYDFTVGSDHSFSVVGYCVHNSHAKDRGILESGSAFDPDYVTSTPLNLMFGNILKPRRIYHPEYLPRSLGGTLESQSGSDRPTSPDFRAAADPNQSHARFAHESDPRLQGGGVSLAPGDAPGINPQTIGWRKRLPHKMKLQDPSRSSLKDRVETGSDAEGFRPTSDQGISPEEMEFIRQIKQDSPVDRMAYQAQEVTGLYGWMAGQIYPDLAQPVGRIQVEDASRSYGVEAKFWDQELGGIGGTAADIARRLFPHRRRSIHSYNPTPNNMPEWLPDAFRHGDPYRKLQMGELRLPGQAYSRSHPGTLDHVWDMRASSLGGTSEEIRDYYLHKGEDNQASEATDTGTKMHRVLQARWRALGILEADEVSVYDKKDNISGHIDAILRMPTANGGFMRVIDDIKTKTPERFEEIQKTGKPEEENLEQIQFYMHTTGIHHALLTYVNRESPEHVFEIPVEYDPALYAKIRKKLNDVRKDLKNQIKSGDINEGAVYNAIDKYEILSEVAPDSPQFMQLQKWASMHNAEQSSDDQYRIKSAQERVRRKREGFELHPYRFKGASEKLTSRSIQVAKILSNTSIEDTHGRKYTLAGISTDEVKSPYETPEEQWNKVGRVHEGSRVQVLIDSQDKDKDSVQAVVLHNGRNIAKSLLRSDLASEKENDFSATAVRNRFTTAQTTMGSVWESMAHADTILNCLAPWTKVITSETIKEVKDLKADELVLTKNGRFKPVVYVKEQPIGKRIVDIKLCSSSEIITLTDDHPVLGLSSTRKRPVISHATKERLESWGRTPKIEFILAGDLKEGDYAALRPRNMPDTPLPIIDLLAVNPIRFEGDDSRVWVTSKGRNSKQGYAPRFITMDSDLARLMGYYAAEGCIGYSRNRPSTLDFTLHVNEKEYIQDICTLLSRFTTSKVRVVTVNNTVHVCCTSCHLSELFAFYCGQKSKKHAPESLLTTNIVRAEFLRGLMRGDGAKAGYSRYTSISLRAPQIIGWVRDALANLWSIPSIVSPYTNERGNLMYKLNIGSYLGLADFIDSNIIYTSIKIEHKGSKISDRAIINGYILYRIKTVSLSEYQGVTYDVEVEDDDSFATLNSVVHNTKFMPVRSGLEQYERTDVYGKKSGSWDNPVRDYLLPTIASFAHQNPLEAAAKGAFFFSLFAEKSKEKLTLGLVGAGLGLAGSTLGRLGTSRSAPPIPSWVRKRRNIEEYYDNLTYLKYSALANKESELAYTEEKTSVNDLDGRYGNLSTKARDELDSLSARSKALSETSKEIQNELHRQHLSSTKEHSLRDKLEAASELAKEIQERKSALRQELAPVGPHAMRSMLYHQRALATIRGATESGSVNQAIAALPAESRQAIASVIKTGSKQDKQRLYNLLPGYQKSALGYYLGVDPRSIPKAESLSHYFEHHALPRENWKGWRPDMSLDLIEVKDIAEHHKDLDPMDFNIYPSRIEEATLFSPESSVSSPAQGSGYASIGAIHGEIERLLSGKGLFGIKIRVEEMPAASEQGSHQASVNINVNHRREHAFMHHARNH